MDKIDRELVSLLARDGRATYQELGHAVRLSPTTTADRVRRLRRSGVIAGYRAVVDPQALGRPLTMISDVRLREGFDSRTFIERLVTVPQVTGAMRLTGEYDLLLRLSCVDSAEFESAVDKLKQDLGVRELRSRLLLREVDVGMEGLLDLR